MRIGVLGGAFDPPHAAHAALARAAQRQLSLDRVVWVPTFSPPHKHGPATPFAHRLAMVRALIATEPAFSEVSDIEAALPLPSYSLQTLRALKQLEATRAQETSPVHWHLIIGADNWSIFPAWHQPEAVLAEASLAVYPRAGFALETLPALPQGSVMLNFAEMPEQSTVFRESLGQEGPRRDEALGRLPGPVAAYIREHRLYLA